MQITKDNNNSTYLITELVKATSSKNVLSDTELKFIGLPYLEEKLSLTAAQDKSHQLRFFHNEYAFSLINSIAIKLVNSGNVYEDTKIFGSGISPYEIFFLERLNQLSQYSFTFVVKSIVEKEVEYSYDNFRYFQEIGNNFTAKIIGEKLFLSSQICNDINFLKFLSFAYSETGTPLAAEPLLRRVINSKENDELTNEARISAMYRMSMLLLREYPKQFQDKNEAKNFLDNAYNKLIDPNYIFPEEIRLFARVFNRNGLALVLFQNNQYIEAIELIKSLIKEIKPLSDANSFAKLHFVVLNYNLFQLYNANDEKKEAEETIKYVIELDPNDIDYKYDYILLLLANNKAEEAKDILEQMYRNGIYDLVFHNTYLGYYYIQKKDFLTAEDYCEKAYTYFTSRTNQNKNQFLYNYLFCLKNNNRYEIMNKLKKEVLTNEYLAEEIMELYDI